MTLKKYLFLFSLFCIIGTMPMYIFAQKKLNENLESKDKTSLDLIGLSLSIDAGCSFPNNYQAAFYNGTKGNQNTIDRILYSQVYGEDIWNNLVNQGLISPSAITNYHGLQIVENAKTEYSIAFQVGLGLRYDIINRFGVLARFDYSKLTAKGIFNLASGNASSILNNTNQYIPCNIYGTESRSYIDLGIFKSFYLSPYFRLITDIGININSTKVLSNNIQIAGAEYSILDIWNGNSPTYGQQPYEYYQSGIGYGFFFTPSLEFLLPNSMAIDLGVTFYYTKINLPGYAIFKPQYVIFIRVLTNPF